MKHFFRNFFHSQNSYENLNALREGIIFPKNAQYFDWNATALSVSQIEARMHEALKFHANPHSKSAAHAKITSENLSRAKNLIKSALFGEKPPPPKIFNDFSAFFDTPPPLDPESTHFSDFFELIHTGSGATAAIKLFCEIFGIFLPPTARRYVTPSAPLPLVITDSFAHSSNSLSFRQFLCEIYEIPFDLRTKNLDVQDLARRLSKEKNRLIILSLTFASNIDGATPPVREICRIVRAHGGVIALDIASGIELFCAQNPLIPEDFFDALFISPHKILGGSMTCGLLCIKKSILFQAQPNFVGGGNVIAADPKNFSLTQNLSRRFEAGTPLALQTMKTALCFLLQREIGLDFILARKKILSDFLRTKLLEFGDEIRIYGHSSGAIAFNLRGISPFVVAHHLSADHGVQCRAGFSCAFFYGHFLLAPDPKNTENDSFFENGFVRASIHYTHTTRDLEAFCTALREVFFALRPFVKISKNLGRA